jgi:hypothetical protein
MKRLLVVLLFLVANAGWGQVYIENFSYTAGSVLTSVGGWGSIGTSAGTNTLTISSSGLSYPSSPASGIGLSCSFTNSGQDAGQLFASTYSSTALYASFLVKINSALSAGDYFAGFMGGTLSNPAYPLRIWVRSTGSNFAFGLSKFTNTTTILPLYEASETRNFGQTYLIVIKYTFAPGTSDDVVSMWVNPQLGATESTPTLTTTITNSNDQSSIVGFFIRQGSSANAPAGEIDGIRVDPSWQLVPVTMTSFSATKDGKNNLLSWATASEQNNAGFEVQRSTDGSTYENIGFVKSLSATGNSSSPLSYSFTDFNPLGLQQYYRLKQTDLDGKSAYSAIVLVKREAPATLTVTKVYPNPSTSSIYINAACPAATTLQLSIVDMNGRVVGRKQVNAMTGNNGFDMPVTQLAPGTYLLQVLNADSKVVTTEKFIKQ